MASKHSHPDSLPLTSRIGARSASPTRPLFSPRILILTDQSDFARALEQHVSIIWPEAECRVHSPLQSGRLHPAFTAAGYDAVLLDDRVERGAGEVWLDNLLHRSSFPPVLYFARGDDPARAVRVVERGAIASLVRERIDHRRLSQGLRDAVLRRRDQVTLWRSTPECDEASRFGPVKIIGCRFVRALAEGGDARVYLAESERAGDMVVLKVLRERPDVGEGHQQFARFLQEYELISNIRHAHVVRIYDLGIADDHAYIAMEYFPRGDLRARIAKGIERRRAVDYLAQMASALHVVHSVGVLHRDLKPGNIMVRADDSLALIDFGLAKHGDAALEMTAAGAIFGTPYYMSPEQGHGREVDSRSDLYSLGVIFFEMLMRRKPFLAATPMGVIYLHANAPTPTLEGESVIYQPLLQRLLAKSPDERFSSAAELLTALAPFVNA